MIKQHLLNLAAEKNIVVSAAEIDTFITNLPNYEDEIRSNITVELWDGVSPVGNVAADEIKSRPDFPKAENAKAFFIKIDGIPLYFQYHTILGYEPITEENYLTEAEKIIKQYVETRVIEQATKLFLEQFSNRTQANIVYQRQLDLMAALADIAVKLGVIYYVGGSLRVGSQNIPMLTKTTVNADGDLVLSGQLVHGWVQRP